VRDGAWPLAAACPPPRPRRAHPSPSSAGRQLPGKICRAAQNLPTPFCRGVGGDLENLNKNNEAAPRRRAAGVGTGLADLWIEQNAPGRQNGSRHT